MDIKVVYDFILAQYSAESYWDNLYGTEPFDIEDRLQRRSRLINGANRYDKISDLISDGNLGPTQMTEVMVSDFEATWKIVTHIPNQISGFSATLLKNKNTGEFTLSFRSTESKTEDDGGDRQRDVYGADSEIAFDGFSFAQIQDMELFYEQIKNGFSYNEETQNYEVDASLNEFKNYITTNQINVTGYSLGGHLAQVFTLLHYDDVLHTYTFNGAGFGDFSGLTGSSTVNDYATSINAAVENLGFIISSPLDYIDQIGGGDLLAIINEIEGRGLAEGVYQAVLSVADVIGAVLPKLQGQIVSTAADLLEFYRDTIVSEEDKSLLIMAFQQIHDEVYQYTDITLDSRYGDPLYIYAEKILSKNTESAGLISLKEEILNDRIEYGREQITPDDKITNLFGQTYVDKLFSGELVAGSGQIFGDFSGIFVEDQPPVDFSLDSFLDSFGNNHSITLLADSLALMSVFDAIDPNINNSGNNRFEINQILASSSNSNSNYVPFFEKAEGDTLEKALDMLGRLFLPASWTITSFSYDPDSFADVDLRNEFYNHLQLLRTELLDIQGNLKPEYQGLRITSLYNENATEFKLKAEGDPLVLTNIEDSIAYRYALKELNPFVITGVASIYDVHNTDKGLDIFDPETNEGTLTEEYLEDRIAFLTTLIESNLKNEPDVKLDLGEKYLGATFIDEAKGIEITNYASYFSEENQYKFGSDQSDGQITGGSKDDHLYGGDGIESLYGLEGNDYIEGNQDNDVLAGGSGQDTLIGGQGTDILWHNDVSNPEDDKNKDTLNGGLDNDQYYVGHLDEIEDSDPENQTGLIDFNGVDVRGTYEHLVGEVYKNESNGLLLTLSSRDANIKRVTNDGITFFTIKNFLDENGSRTDGEYDIFIDIPTPPEPTTVYTNPTGTTEFTIRENNLVSGSTIISGPYEKSIGNNDASTAIDTFGVIPIHEIIDVELSPGFEVDGGFGNDWIRIDYNYTPFIGGQTYIPSAGNPGGFASGVTVDGQGGDDIIYGGLDDDQLFGGQGDDLLATWDGNDIHNGGAGYDTLGSNDYFYGLNQTQGTTYDVKADDFYFGEAGNDFISDDWGNDTALGGDDSDFIATGSGSDTILGGKGNDIIFSDQKYSGIHGSRDWILDFNANGQPTSITFFSITDQGQGLQAAGDFIDGGDGSDLIQSGKGDDTVLGGSGNDGINAQEGDDYVDGGDDNDLIYGEDGFDVLQGGSGNDYIYGGNDDDFIEGGADNDNLWGDAGRDNLYGDGGNDIIYGGTEDDSLNGGAGNDELYGDKIGRAHV